MTIRNDTWDSGGNLLRRETIDLDAVTYTLEEGGVVTVPTRPLTAEEVTRWTPVVDREAARRSAEQEIARLTALPLLQAETLTDAQIQAIAAAWESWEPGVAYAVGDVVEFGGSLWEVRQAHTSQADWEPPDVLALFQRFRGAEDPDVTPEWAPATPYAVDDLVTYGGTTYRCLQAHTSQPGWEPPNVPALWAVA
jgi:hypothetical protein